MKIHVALAQNNSATVAAGNQNYQQFVKLLSKATNPAAKKLAKFLPAKPSLNGTKISALQCIFYFGEGSPSGDSGWQVQLVNIADGESLSLAEANSMEKLTARFIKDLENSVKSYNKKREQILKQYAWLDGLSSGK